MNRMIVTAPDGRKLEVRAIASGGDWQLWVYDQDRRIFSYGIAPYSNQQTFADSDPMSVELGRAKLDIESGAISVPAVRS